MQKDMLLMLKNQIVMRINLDKGLFKIIDELHIPFQLKNRIKPVTFQDNISQYEMTQNAIQLAKNHEAITSFLASRILPITRENAKKIYELLNFEQAQDDYSKAKIAVLCRAVSLQDNYWVKLEDDTITWDEINLRTNHLNEIIAQVALHGISLTLTGMPVSPELTMMGAYAKAWKRDDNGLFLYKRSTKDGNESEIEVMVSNLLDKCNVNHLQYFDAISNDKYCCKCKCMTTDDISMLSAMDFISFCNRNDLDPLHEILSIDADSFYKMCIVDYLTANRDRHGLNWGFFYDCNTMNILGCHPLYDHNNCFDPEYMKNELINYQALPGKTLKDAALYAIKKTDFHFTQPITKDDFMNEFQYQMFMKRAKELNISLKRDKTIILEEDDFER